MSRTELGTEIHQLRVDFEPRMSSVEAKLDILIAGLGIEVAPKAADEGAVTRRRNCGSRDLASATPTVLISSLGCPLPQMVKTIGQQHPSLAHCDAVGRGRPLHCPRNREFKSKGGYESLAEGSGGHC